ncbi:TniB family NTP-binding protein [Tardiphaga sp. 285_C5_N1_2]|uniref:ATP-binding protein n=1 Tax=Tardiphaga sp. 285_C5_N1_2 TaxID=3240775 RepID=UPI003F8964B6
MPDDAFPDFNDDPVARLHHEATAAAGQFFSLMETIRAKFLPNDRDDRLSQELTLLIGKAVQREDVTEPPSFFNRARGSGLVLIGPTGVGKSRSLERFFDTHPVLKDYKNPISKSPLVSVAVPSPCTSMQLARTLLRATGYGVERDLPTHRLWEMAFERLYHMRKFIVHFDEMQHVVHNMPDKDLQQMADTLKNAMYKHRITVIISGVSTLEDFIHHDPQLFRRTTIVPFASVALEQHGELLDMVETYAEEAKLRPPFREAVEGDETAAPEGRRSAQVFDGWRETAEKEADFIARLSHASLNAYGYSIVLTHLAIEEALQCGANCLSVDHYATAFARKTAFAANRNPFIAPNWHGIDCSKIFEKKNIDVPDSLPKPRNKRSK